MADPSRAHKSEFRFGLLTWMVVVSLTGVIFAGDAAPAGAEKPSPLQARVLAAVRESQFDNVIDYGPYDEACPGAAFCHSPEELVLPIGETDRIMPNVDVAVIMLDSDGQVLDIANVILSRDYPEGQIVPTDDNFGTGAVRWRRWDIERFDGGTFSSRDGHRLSTKGWVDNPPLTDADDITPGFESAPFQFMSPYPASLFKILVAYFFMRLVDDGRLTLDDQYSYIGVTRPIQEWLDRMITFSDNVAARALLKYLHDRNWVTAMNAEFRNLGLSTLQINGTDPITGGNWQPGMIHMTALDTARLLWLIHGAAGPLWNRPNGEAVTADELSDASRAFLLGLLSEQGFNEVLSTTNFCGAPNTNPGIPAPVASRWIDPVTGYVTVDNVRYGRDVRPCNADADVIYGHKTGLTFNYGSDAGIVYPREGRATNRRYVIAFLANLGYRFTDPIFRDRRTFPCFDAVGGICYTQRIPALGKQIDDFIKALTDP